MEKYGRLKRRTKFEEDTCLQKIGIDYETSDLWLNKPITL
jgi:hypothetical protein